MRVATGWLLVCALLAGCAAPRAPGPVSAPERAAPHHVRVSAGPPSVAIDADTTVVVPGFIPLSPLGLLVGVAVQAATVAAQAPGVHARGSRRDALQAALGGTTDPAQAFADVFSAALEQRLRQTSSLQVASFGLASELPAPDSTSGRLLVTNDVKLSQDARMIVARAALQYAAPGTTSLVPRHFLVVSEPISADTEVAAIERWKESDGALLRERGRAVAEELAALIVDTLFHHEIPDVAALPNTRVTTPGFAYLRGRTQAGEAWTARLPEQIRAPVIRQAAGRATLLVAVPPNLDLWIWVSVPASMLPQPGS